MFKGVASRALGVFALFTVVCGLGYTLVVTGIAQVAFPYQANGSLIKVDDKIVGSELIGQNFEDEDHMWGRIQNVTIVEGRTAGLLWPTAPRPTSPRRARSTGSLWTSASRRFAPPIPTPTWMPCPSTW
ncbi:MAG: potassium-transporting ATPase subunit C [Collinsella sp.]